MRLGLLLPTFADSAEPALATAAAAEEAGLDGVFAYDHLWPMGAPTRPALAPLPVLAAVAARHQGLVVGPLVARVGLVGADHLVRGLTTLTALAPAGVIAALGTGDRLSAAENEAYGIAERTAEERRALLAEVASSLEGVAEVWVGAGSTATNVAARCLGATLNLWDANPEEVARAREEGPVSWAGPPGEDLEGRLDALAAAGATWAVLTPSVDPTRLGAWRHRA